MTHATAVGRNIAIAAVGSGAGWWPSKTEMRRPNGSMSAVANVAIAVFPRVDGTRSGKAISQTATEDQPFGSTPVATGTE